MVIVWDAATGQTRYETHCETKPTMVAFCPPKGDLIAIGSIDRPVELRRADTWHPAGSFNAEAKRYSSFSRDGKLFARTGRGLDTFSLWDTAANIESVNHDWSHEALSFYVGFVPGDDGLILSLDNQAVSVWDADVRLLKTVYGFGGQERAVRRPHFSPDGKFVWLRMETRKIQLWTKDMARKVASYDNLSDMIFSPNSRYIALRPFDRGEPYITDSSIELWPCDKVRIIDSMTFEQTATFDCDVHYPFTFSPTGQVVGWVDAHERFMLSDLATGEHIVVHAQMHRHLEPQFTFSPGGEVVLLGPVATDEHEVYSSYLLLEVSSGKTIAVLRMEYEGFAESVFHPKGNFLATAQHSTDISVWSTASGFQVHTLKVNALGHDFGYLSMEISTTGKLVASVYYKDKREARYAILVWDLATGAQIGRLNTNKDVSGLSFSADSQYLENRYGRFPLPPPTSDQGADPDDASTEAVHDHLYIRDRLFIREQWVVHGDDDILWIPPAYRNCYPAVRGGTIAFGGPRGLVVLLKVDLTETPLSSRAKGVCRAR